MNIKLDGVMLKYNELNSNLRQVLAFSINFSGLHIILCECKCALVLCLNVVRI